MPFLNVNQSGILHLLANLICLFYYISTATWPSGKAEACKAFTPGSNPGVAFLF